MLLEGVFAAMRVKQLHWTQVTLVEKNFVWRTCKSFVKHSQKRFLVIKIHLSLERKLRVLASAPIQLVAREQIWLGYYPNSCSCRNCRNMIFDFKKGRFRRTTSWARTFLIIDYYHQCKRVKIQNLIHSSQNGHVSLQCHIVHLFITRVSSILVFHVRAISSKQNLRKRKLKVGISRTRRILIKPLRSESYAHYAC